MDGRMDRWKDLIPALSISAHPVRFNVLFALSSGTCPVLSNPQPQRSIEGLGIVPGKVVSST